MLLCGTNNNDLKNSRSAHSVRVFHADGDLLMDLTFVAIDCERKWDCNHSAACARSVSLTML
jgi:hypothetical protein